MEKVVPGELPPGEDLQTLFDTLRHLTEALESKELSLEDAVKTYEEALAVEKRIRAVLDDADKKVMILSEGKIVPFYTDE